MNPFTSQTFKVAPLLVDDIDTDQILPARFLKVVDKAGLGEKLFHDWRYDATGAPRPEFVLNQPTYQGAQALLAGKNFGCGSSREHAPWGLMDHGFRVILARSFGDIFRNNSLKNGLLPVELDDQAYAELAAAAEPGAAAISDGMSEAMVGVMPEVMIDLETQVAILPSGRAARFAIDPFAKRCLLQGIDELGYLQSFEAQIAAHEARQ
jgi:3-isopropylmalate/(R)-2-methylmalate dehydratase small subunit